MTISSARFTELLRRHRPQAGPLGVAVVALLVFVAVGSAARHRLVAERSQLDRMTDASSDLSNFRSAFRAPASPAEDDLALPDSLAVAVTHGVGITLARRVASRAEQSGLGDVRVKFVAPDSGTAPGRPNLIGTTVAVADYSIALECSGGLADILTFVNQLPPSVALQQLAVVRQAGAAPHFRLILAVFETAGEKQHG